MPGPSDLTPIPMILRALKTVGVSNRKVAQALAVSDMSVSRWLSGRCRPSSDREIALAQFAAQELPPESVTGTLPEDRVAAFIGGSLDPALRGHLETILVGGNEMRRMRVASGLTVVEAARRLGVTRQYLHALERATSRTAPLVRHLRKAERVFQPIDRTIDRT